jgi:hypothetical protein
MIPDDLRDLARRLCLDGLRLDEIAGEVARLSDTAGHPLTEGEADRLARGWLCAPAEGGRT